MNFRKAIRKISPTWLRGPWGERLMEGGIGLGFDLVQHAAVCTRRAQLVRDSYCPPDAIGMLGRNRRMERYPGESDLQYRNRLVAAWTTWSEGGTQSAIIKQLGAIGVQRLFFTIFWDGFFEWPPDTSDWSRFRVTLTQPLPWPISGLYSIAWQRCVRGIVDKWKSGHERCVSITAVFSGFVYGTPLAHYGAPGVTYGGEAVTI